MSTNRPPADRGSAARAGAQLERVTATHVAWAIALAGLGLRLVMAWQWNRYSPRGVARLGGDALGYDQLARDLLSGYGFTWPGRVPLYPLWVAGLHAVFGSDYEAFYYAQAVVSLAVVPLTFALGRRVGGDAVGLVAAALAAVSYVLIRHAAVLQSEVLFTPVVLAATIALHDLLEAPSARRGALTGMWIGVANLVRPTLVLFPLAAAALLLLCTGARRGLRLALLCIGTTLLVQAPWMAHNARLGRPVLTLATSNGILWQGSPEYYHLTHDEGYSYMRVWNDVLYSHADSAPDPGSVAGEEYWRARALRSIAREPLTYARYAAEKTVTYWIGDHNADWADSFTFDARALLRWGFPRREVVAMVAARSIVPLLALASLLLVWRRWRRLVAPLAVIVYCTLLHAATHAEARLSEPLQPLLLVLIAMGGVELGRRTAVGAERRVD
jgi:4-amino-4-deoxy-L-arabinose transferase-like glycosyltransferase